MKMLHSFVNSPAQYMSEGDKPELCAHEDSQAIIQDDSRLHLAEEKLLQVTSGNIRSCFFQLMRIS
jgi:hypothetical protein